MSRARTELLEILRKETNYMHDLLIAVSFIAMIIAPCVVATISSNADEVEDAA
jgi:hypothetical protein